MAWCQGTKSPVSEILQVSGSPPEEKVTRAAEKRGEQKKKSGKSHPSGRGPEDTCPADRN